MTTGGAAALVAPPRPPEEGGTATLPYTWYRDPAVLDAEEELLLRPAWQYAGPAAWVAEPGSYFAATCAGVPVVVVRDTEGVLRAHVNVCRHRGTVVARGCGSCTRLRCPYHAWTYALDGTLVVAPRSAREAGFDGTALSLLPAHVLEWGPLVFVAVGSDPSPLGPTLERLASQLSAVGIEHEGLRFWGRSEWTSGANWKIVLENYLECYHCGVAHPGFAAVMDTTPEGYELSGADGLLSHRAPLRQEGAAPPYPALGPVTAGAYHVLLPNMTFDINPGQPNLAVSVTLPDGTTRSKGHTDRFFGEGVDPGFVSDMIAFDDEVNAQDEELVAAVQQGVGSGALGSGRLLLGSEGLLAAFQEFVRRGVGADPRVQPPRRSP